MTSIRNSLLCRWGRLDVRINSKDSCRPAIRRLCLVTLSHWRLQSDILVARRWGTETALLDDKVCTQFGWVTVCVCLHWKQLCAMLQVVECVPNFSEGRDQKVRLEDPRSYFHAFYVCAINLRITTSHVFVSDNFPFHRVFPVKNTAKYVTNPTNTVATQTLWPCIRILNRQQAS